MTNVPPAFDRSRYGPASGAAYDQAHAAAQDAHQRLVRVGAAHGGVKPGWVQLEGPLRELGKRFLAVAGSCGRCAHLLAPGPQPMHWLACRPMFLSCAECLAFLCHTVTPVEDLTCDSCGSVEEMLFSGTMEIPAVVVLRPGDNPSAWGPVLVSYGFCRKCEDASHVTPVGTPPETVHVETVDAQ